jgi:hypothetical protein
VWFLGSFGEAHQYMRHPIMACENHKVTVTERLLLMMHSVGGVNGTVRLHLFTLDFQVACARCTGPVAASLLHVDFIFHNSQPDV